MYKATGNPVGRPREFNVTELPAEVVKIVCAYCADFSRREKAIKAGSDVEERLRRTYVNVNKSIERALEQVEKPCRKKILDDIAKNRGYSTSLLSSIFSKKAYYRRKKQVIYNIAKELNLI